MKKPSILFCFASNDLAKVEEESKSIKSIVSENPVIMGEYMHDPGVIELVEKVSNLRNNLFMFHFGGHAEDEWIVLNNFERFSKERLATILLPGKKSNAIQLIFINGCETYNHVDVFIDRGAKAVIATNKNVNDETAAILARLFYNSFVRNNDTLQVAFQTAASIVEGSLYKIHLAYRGASINKGDFQSDWALFVNDMAPNIIDWRIDDFLRNSTDKDSSLVSDQSITPFSQVIEDQKEGAMLSTNQNNKDPKDLMTLVLADRLKEALEILRDQVDTYDQMTIISLMGRLSRLEGDIRKGVISRSDADVSRNRIRAAVMEYVK